jgi:hypothetical protein
LKLKEAESEFSIINEEGLLLSGKDLAGLVQETLAKGTCFKLKAKGFSMLPFIRDGDVVTIFPISNFPIGFGKSAAFIDSKTGKLVIHRIIGKNNGLYFIKGDNAFSADGLITQENILGCITKIERNGKNIFLGLGWERFIIALFSKIRIWSLVLIFWNLLPLSIRNAIKHKI